MHNLSSYSSQKFTSAIHFFKQLALWQRILSVLVFIILLQMFIPTGLVSYGSKLDGKSVSLQSTKTVDKQLEKNASTIVLAFDTKHAAIPSTKAGVLVDTQKTVDQLPRVTLVDKIIPFGPIVKIFDGKQVTSVKDDNSEKIKAVAADLSKTHSTEPKNATATIASGKLIIEKAKSGQVYSEQAIAEAITNVQPYQTDPVNPASKKIAPEITEDAFASVQKELSAATAKKMIIKYGDKTKEIDAETFKAWLEVAQKEDGSFYLNFSDSAMQELIDSMAKEYNVPAGISQVTTMDGKETSRSNGKSGTAIETDKASIQLREWLGEPKNDAINIATVTVAPRVNTTRFYSASSAGLQAKINEWIAANGGSGKYQVAVQELGGQGRVASYNVSQQTVMASTYKLFLAYVAYTQAESGALNLGAQLSCGKNIQQGIEIMIVQSDNDCAVALGKYIGWAKVDQIIASSGFKNVRLNNYNANGSMNGDKQVNAGELAKFLAQLSGGSLINSGNTNTLLGYMKRQVYREGVPAGSRGSVVADKVGFLEGYLHDAAIVYSPNSTYAIVIMSSGSSWKNIASLSGAIYDFMNE